MFNIQCGIVNYSNLVMFYFSENIFNKKMKDAATLMRAVASAQKYDNVSKKACLDDFKVIMF